MNKKEKKIIKGAILFILGIIFGAVLFVLLIVSFIVFSPLALIIWLCSKKSFLDSWGGIGGWWRLLLDMLKEIEDNIGLGA